MQPRSAKHLEDIRRAAAQIMQFVTDRTLEQYRADPMLRSAVERQFEIMGEAIGRIARQEPTVAARIGDYAKIIAFRNVLIHGYDLIDDAEVWRVARAQVAPLHDQVIALLKESLNG